MTSVGGGGAEGSVSAAVEGGFDRDVFCDQILFEIACGMVDSDLLVELSLIISSSRAFIFGFVDPDFFSTPAFNVKISRDLDSSGALSLIAGTAGTL